MLNITESFEKMYKWLSVHFENLSMQKYGFTILRFITIFIFKTKQFYDTIFINVTIFNQFILILKKQLIIFFYSAMQRRVNSLVF